MKKLVTPFAFIFMATTLFNFYQKLDEIASVANIDQSYGHLQQTKIYSSEVAFNGTLFPKAISI